MQYHYGSFYFLFSFTFFYLISGLSYRVYFLSVYYFRGYWNPNIYFLSCLFPCGRCTPFPVPSLRAAPFPFVQSLRSFSLPFLSLLITGWKLLTEQKERREKRDRRVPPPLDGREREGRDRRERRNAERARGGKRLTKESPAKKGRHPAQVY